MDQDEEDKVLVLPLMLLLNRLESYQLTSMNPVSPHRALEFVLGNGNKFRLIITQVKINYLASGKKHKVQGRG
jgi:hypothetical protein